MLCVMSFLEVSDVTSLLCFYANADLELDDIDVTSLPS